MHITINILLLTMLINAVYNFIFKKKFYTLNCGIFAWVGDSPDKFNPILFNILGVYNDTRGGDSCGVYFNKTYIKGIGKLSHYQDLVINEHLMSKVDVGEIPIAIGHTRKASVGAVSFDNTQPVLVINNKKKISYVHAHNGTLSNYKELAKKYKIDSVDGETDSNVLAKLIANNGFDILKEYEGTAALVMHFTKEPNVLYAFHGKSTKWSYAPSEERPLHYINSEEMGTYISSESIPLDFIGDGNIKVNEFKYNVLYKLEGNSVTEFKTIDRTQENKKTPTQSVMGFRSHSNYYEDDDTLINRNVRSKNICKVEIGRTNGNVKGDVLRWTNGYFYIGKDLAHGYYNSDAWGYVSTYYSSMAIDRHHLWFFMGILLCNKSYFDELLIECMNKKMDVKTAMSDYEHFRLLSNILKRGSVFPFTRMSEHDSGVMQGSAIMPNNNNGALFYNGSFTPLFSDWDLYFNGGDYVGRGKTASKKMYTIEDLLADYTDLYYESFGEPSVGELDYKNTPAKIEDTPVNTEESPNKLNKENEEELQVLLEHTISTQLVPIVKGLEGVISDIENSGYQESVKDTLEIITNSKKQLTTIL